LIPQSVLANETLLDLYLKEGRISEVRDHLEFYNSIGKLGVGVILAQSQLNKDPKDLVAFSNVLKWEVGLINLPFLEVPKENFYWKLLLIVYMHVMLCLLI
jgi:hypothetical protein